MSWHVVMATPHRQGTNGRLTRDVEKNPASGNEDAESAAYPNNYIGDDVIAWIGSMQWQLDGVTD